MSTRGREKRKIPALKHTPIILQQGKEQRALIWGDWLGWQLCSEIDFHLRSPTAILNLIARKDHQDFCLKHKPKAYQQKKQLWRAGNQSFWSLPPKKQLLRAGNQSEMLKWFKRNQKGQKKKMMGSVSFKRAPNWGFGALEKKKKRKEVLN